jgi:hypothetical protein
MGFGRGAGAGRDAEGWVDLQTEVNSWCKNHTDRAETLNHKPSGRQFRAFEIRRPVHDRLGAFSAHAEALRFRIFLNPANLPIMDDQSDIAAPTEELATEIATEVIGHRPSKTYRAHATTSLRRSSRAASL